LRRGIRTTSLERTIRDCARTLGEPALRKYLQEAERQRFDIRLLDRPGIPRNLRRALDRYIRGSGWTANELEARFYELCVQAGLPRPRTQRSLDGGSMIIDFIWDDIGLIVETDGRGHDGWIAASEDRARDRRLFIDGFHVLRFTWADVRWDPEMVKADMTAAFARLRR
jgi:very-short-patch-repair endonuclease